MLGGSIIALVLFDRGPAEVYSHHASAVVVICFRIAVSATKHLASGSGLSAKGDGRFVYLE